MILLMKCPEQGNLERQKVDQWFLKAEEWGWKGWDGGGVTAEGYGVSFRHNKHILKLTTVMVAHDREYIETTELQTSMGKFYDI